MRGSRKKPVVLIALWAFLISFFSTAFPLAGLSFAVERPETIRVGGTGMAMETMRLLAERFRKIEPSVNIVIFPSLGSGGGLKALLEGEMDIAVSAKHPSDEDAKKGFVSRELGETPIVFVTNRKVPASNISIRQAADIYEGKTSAWREGFQLRLILRPLSDSITQSLMELSDDMKKAVHASLSREGYTMAVSDQENLDLIEKLPGSFGAAALCQVAAEKRNVNILSLDGKKPASKNRALRDYPLTRRIFAVTGPKSSSASRRFTDYIFSAAGRTFLKESGYLVPDAVKREN